VVAEAPLAEEAFTEMSLASRLQGTLVAGVLEQLWSAPPQDALGAAYFSNVTVSCVLGMTCKSSAVLAKPVTVHVMAITGLRRGDSDDKRVAKLTWRFEAPAMVLRYLGLKAGSLPGNATLQRYDDGWRLTNLDLGQTAGAFKQAFVHDAQAEAAGRAVLLEQQGAEQARAEASRQRIEQMRVQAMSSTRELGTFRIGRRESGCCSSGRPNAYKIVDGTLRVTDADLHFTPSAARHGSRSIPATMGA
jgi:hypothetical protein